MLKLSQPEVVEHAPFLVVGCYRTFQGDDEGPGWEGAHRTFFPRAHEVQERKGDLVFGFLYRPRRDDPAIDQSVRSCFVGVEVSRLAGVPEGMHATRFSGGEYAIVTCEGDTAEEAAEGVGEAIGNLDRWLPEHGYVEGDACFAASHEGDARPPYSEYVYMKLERPA
jgi:predicted transcriptional regulator YdeE